MELRSPGSYAKCFYPQSGFSRPDSTSQWKSNGKSLLEGFVSHETALFSTKPELSKKEHSEVSRRPESSVLGNGDLSRLRMAILKKIYCVGANFRSLDGSSYFYSYLHF